MSRDVSSIRLIAGGDVMLGEHPIMVGRGMSTRMQKDPEFSPLSGIAGILQQADLTFANLECVLSDPGPGATPAERECRGPARGIESLAAAGFSALSVANNHIQQHGDPAFAGTIAALVGAGIAPVGLAGDAPGRCQPVDIDRGDLQIRILGYSLRPRQHFTHRPGYAEGTLAGISTDVKEGRRHDRIVVVSLHWGDEFIGYPSREQVALGRAIIDAGATLVLGHHPHVLQGCETYGRGAIVYSLGNLVFDMPWLPELRQSALFSCRLSAAGIDQLTWLPLVLDDRHCPLPAVGEAATRTLEFLQEASDDLSTGSGTWAPRDPREYQRDLLRAAARQRTASHRYFMANLWRYEFAVLRNVIGKFIMRRLGRLND